MNELELCDTLGIILDPERNKISGQTDSLKNVERLSSIFVEMTQQKRRFGTLNPDLWLEFIPWHSLN